VSKEARFFYAALLVASFGSLGASHRTPNFIVTADTPELAIEIGEAAEVYRRDLAIEWLGYELPPWSDICPITAQVSPQLGAGGATSFYFNRGRPHGWRMTLQGPRQRVLDSVLPHEITHTIFATHFGQPLPRWADEGACTMVEHPSEKQKQHQMLVQFLTTGRGIAFNQMFAMREYPPDILPLYAQGYSLAKYLVNRGGKRKFVEYVGDGLQSNNWTAATAKHYGYNSLRELQDTWLAWVKMGSPAQPATLIASQQEIPVQDASTGAAPAATFASTSTPAPAEHRTGSSDDSWYARQRDRHHQQTAAAPSPPDSNPARTSPPARSAVTRAPEVGQLQPIVLPATLQPVPRHTPVPSAW
jgi:hypothetical protein